MKNYVTFIFILLISFFMMSCGVPQTKEAYLENLDKIIADVAENNSDFSDSDWDKIDEKMEKYKGEYYDKFEQEFTPREKAQIIKQLAKYGYFRSVEGVKTLFNEVKDHDFQKDVDNVKDYIENDLEDDIEETGEVLEELIEDAGKGINDLINNLLE